jgi:hypothetical protein
MDKETLELIDEAVMVGLLSLPPWFVASALVDNTKGPGDGDRILLKVFLAGALFHIGAELSGFNDWYIDNGLAKRKRIVGMYEAYGAERGQMGYYYPNMRY